MTILFKNGAVGTLGSGALSTDDTLLLTAGQGGRFPDPQAGEYFVLTIQSGATVEIVHCTARVGDALTVDRAQEGTGATAWLTGAVVDMRVTAGLLLAFLQYAAGASLSLTNITLSAGGVLSGGTIDGTTIQNSTLKLSTILAGEVKPADGNTAKSLRLPNGGGRPTVGAPDGSGTTEIWTQERVNASDMKIQNTAPTLRMLDTSGGTWSGAFHVNDSIAYVIRTDSAGAFAPFASTKWPMSINLNSGSVFYEGWILQGDGNAVSNMFGTLSVKFSAYDSSISTLGTRASQQELASNVQDARIMELAARCNSIEVALVGSGNGVYPDRGY